MGFAVANVVASRLGVSWKKKLFHSYWIGKAIRDGDSIYLVKPLTFMNASGRVFREVMRETGLSPSEILVVCDSLDLSPGSCRFRLKGSAGGHKGLESIIRNIGTEDFMRLLVGIGRPAHKGEVIAYVLQRPRGGEATLIEQGIEKAADSVLLLFAEGPARVMNEINKKEPPS